MNNPVEIVCLIAKSMDESMLLEDLVNLALVSKSFYAVFMQKKYWDKVTSKPGSFYILESHCSTRRLHLNELALAMLESLFSRDTCLPSEAWKHRDLLLNICNAAEFRLNHFPCREDLLPYLNDLELLRAITLQGECHVMYEILHCLPATLTSDKAYMLKLRKHCYIMEIARWLPVSTLHDREFSREIVLLDFESLKYLPVELLNDIEFLKSLAFADPEIVEHFGGLRRDVDFMFEISKRDNAVLKYALGPAKKYFKELNGLTIYFDGFSCESGSSSSELD